MQSTRWRIDQKGLPEYLFDRSELNDEVGKMTCALNNLHDYLGIDDDQSERILYKSLGIINHGFGGVLT